MQLGPFMIPLQIGCMLNQNHLEFRAAS